MGPPPAVVIVVRHGARLDQADKQWHLNSPTPYDPPLTYGGWTSCRTLGVRIAELLQTREQIFETTHHDHEEEEQENGHTKSGGSPRPGRRGRPRKKKHRIIIHSSPFLRCVQSSIALSSGISQVRGLNNSGRSGQRRGRDLSQDRSPEFSSLSTIADEGISRDAFSSPHISRSSSIRTKLRLDPFLGEWLSPDYYESITPPPNSVLMLASAKSELLHRADPISAEEQRPVIPRPRQTSSGGLWESPTAAQSPADSGDEHALQETEESIPRSRPRPKDRSASHGADKGLPTSPRRHKRGSFTSRTGYTPPTPLYSISPTEPIPAGYVAHARDNCVDVDFQWDSMKPPQNWGDGGSYGEEWSAMHKRFRYGLNAMITWYRHHFESSHQLHGHLRTLHPPKRDEDDNSDTDTVLILVTHSAGCNALIGALTNQPVLIDIPMSSLTMAVRRDRPVSPPPATKDGRSSSIISDAMLSTEYEVSLTASMEHLRPGSASSASSSTPAGIDVTAALKVFAPQSLKRSNTLPIRQSAPPVRHVSPVSRNRSTSVNKMSFVPSPLNPNANGVTSSPIQQKTWLESHKPAPQMSWMEAHKQQTSSSANTSAPPSESEEPGTPSSTSKSAYGGLWQNQSQTRSTGLWTKPTSIPQSGPGTAGAAHQTWQPPQDAPKSTGWLAPPTLSTSDSPSDKLKGSKTSRNASPRSDTRSVRFADSSKSDDDYEDLSPLSLQSSHSFNRDAPSQEELEAARFGGGLDEREVARLSKLPPADVRIRELGMKRRWTMNDDRNQERDTDDWRMEQWM